MFIRPQNCVTALMFIRPQNCVTALMFIRPPNCVTALMFTSILVAWQWWCCSRDGKNGEQGKACSAWQRHKSLHGAVTWFHSVAVCHTSTAPSKRIQDLSFLILCSWFSTLCCHTANIHNFETYHVSMHRCRYVLSRLTQPCDNPLWLTRLKQLKHQLTN